MKKLKLILAIMVVGLSFNACQQDDDIEFVATEAGDFTFNTTFLENYILNASVGDNLAERFTWNNADFAVPTNVTYNLQAATMADFSDYVAGEPMYNLGNTQGNEIAVTVSKMIALAHAAGLDNDPATADVPNTGQVYFRLLAVVGDDGLPSYSAVQALNVELQEQTEAPTETGVSEVSWGVVGSGYNAWGEFADQSFYTTDTDGVIVTYVTLIDGEIKFRENNAWDSDLGDTDADGTLEPGGTNIVVTAGNYKITIDLNASTYTMEPFSWGVVGEAYNNWGETPDAKFTYDYTTDTFKLGVRLLDGEMKFRKNNAWDTDFGDSGADGTLDAGGDNIVVSAGHYAITLDFNAGTYTLEPADIWGVVGSGYNEWGETPDFSFTEVRPDFWEAEIVTILDGEIKFRLNNDWASDYGDTGADGTLDAGGENIVTTAGLYRIQLDLAAGTYAMNKVQ